MRTVSRLLAQRNEIVFPECRAYLSCNGEILP